jgi:hypothetical protein
VIYRQFDRRDFITFFAAAVAMLGFPGCVSLSRNLRKPSVIAPDASHTNVP